MNDESKTASKVIQNRLGKLAEALMCCICREVLSTPIDLGCTHCVCEGCWKLQEQIQTTKRKKSSKVGTGNTSGPVMKRCPECKHVINRREMSQSDILTQLAAQLREGISAFGFVLNGRYVDEPGAAGDSSAASRPHPRPGVLPPASGNGGNGGRSVGKSAMGDEDDDETMAEISVGPHEEDADDDERHAEDAAVLAISPGGGERGPLCSPPRHSQKRRRLGSYDPPERQPDEEDDDADANARSIIDDCSDRRARGLEDHADDGRGGGHNLRAGDATLLIEEAADVLRLTQPPPPPSVPPPLRPTEDASDDDDEGRKTNRRSSGTKKRAGSGVDGVAPIAKRPRQGSTTGTRRMSAPAAHNSARQRAPERRGEQQQQYQPHSHYQQQQQPQQHGPDHGAARTYAVGETVHVVARTWPGINKQGGAGLITAVNGDGTYDIKYVLRGFEVHVSPQFIHPLDLSGSARGERHCTRRISMPSSSSSASATHRTGNAASLAPLARTLVSPTARAPAGGRRHKSLPSSSTASLASKSKENNEPVGRGRGRRGEGVGLEPAAAAGGGGGGGGGGGAAVVTPDAPGPPQPNAANTDPLRPAALLRDRVYHGDGAADGSYTTRPRDIVLLATALKTDALRTRVEEFKHRFNVSVVDSPGPDVTHVVCRADGKRRAEQRTLKYLHGLVRGQWLLSTQWLADSLNADRVLPEANYELTGDNKAAEPSAPIKARLSRHKGAPGLFNGYRFSYYGKEREDRPKKLDLEFLAGGGQGVVIPDISRYLRRAADALHRRESAPEESWGEQDDELLRDMSKVVILCDELPENDRRGNVLSAAFGDRPLDAGPYLVRSEWLLDSISSYRPQPFVKYVWDT